MDDSPSPTSAPAHGAGDSWSTPNRKRQRRDFLSIVGLLLGGLLFALLLTSFVFQSYAVDGQSMESTLHNGDRLIVLKLPRTWARITRHPYLPKRGDIVIFNKYGLSTYGETGNKQLIKRVIGLPGERVVVNDGNVTIFNKDHPTGFQPDRTEPWSKAILTTPGNIDLTVPPNEVFVCGDNRPYSLDSRAFGTVPVKDVVGKLALRVLPLSGAEVF